MTKWVIGGLLGLNALIGIAAYEAGEMHVFNRSPPVYVSSLDVWEPIKGLIHIDCHTGIAGERRKIDARALGITFDSNNKVRILVETNDTAQDKYSSSFWLEDAGLCKLYVRERAYD